MRLTRTLPWIAGCILLTSSAGAPARPGTKIALRLRLAEQN